MTVTRVRCLLAVGCVYVTVAMFIEFEHSSNGRLHANMEQLLNNHSGVASGIVRNSQNKDVINEPQHVHDSMNTTSEILSVLGQVKYKLGALEDRMNSIVNITLLKAADGEDLKIASPVHHQHAHNDTHKIQQGRLTQDPIYILSCYNGLTV